MRSISIPKNPNFNDPDWLREQYESNSLPVLARECGVGRARLRRQLVEFGVDIRTTENRFEGRLVFRPIEVVEDGSARVPLTKGYYATIDEEDIPLVEGRNWYVNGKKVKYADTQNRRSVGRLRMHRVIIGAPAGVFVDHVDGDGLNNRRSNLRLATVQENGANSRHPAGASGYRGVRRTKTGRFEAYVSGHDDYIYVGTFDCAEDAAIARDIAALERYGEFAVLNFPELEAV